MGKPSLQPYCWNFLIGVDKTNEKNFLRARFRYILWIKRHIVYIAPQRDLILDGPLSIVPCPHPSAQLDSLPQLRKCHFCLPKHRPFRDVSKNPSSLAAGAQDPTESPVLWCGWLAPCYALLTPFSSVEGIASLSHSCLCYWTYSMTSLDTPSPDFHDPFLLTLILCSNTSWQRLWLVFDLVLKICLWLNWSI